MLDDLQNWGCDVEDALERFVGDKDLYVMCMNLFVDDGSFEALGNAINSGDDKAAFEAAHTLKGVAGNVSATPLFTQIDYVTEKLRKGEMNGVQEEYAQILNLRDSLKAILNG